jgi:hypothetical protein
MSSGSDGTLNLWNTKLQLQRVATHNFKAKGMAPQRERQDVFNDHMLRSLILSDEEEEKGKENEVRVILSSESNHH